MTFTKPLTFIEFIMSRGTTVSSKKYLGGLSVVFDVIVDKILGKKPSVDSHFLTSNSIIIQYFYRHTVYVLLIIYSLSIYNGFNEKIISCMSGFNGHEPSADIYYYCLTYPFVISNEKKPTYILFYKWVPWTLLICGFMFYIPKSMVKFTSCTHTSKFLSNITTHNITGKDICSFLNTNWDTFKCIYISSLFCHTFALVVNVSIFFMLDFCLQGRFFYYIPRTYPFNRTPFSDNMSTIFPPFVTCNVTKSTLHFERSDTFKCHLFLMDYYEKIFIGLWLWIVFLTIITILYILFLLSFNFLFVKIWIYKNPTRVGNIFVLYKLKTLLTTRQYEQVLLNIVIKTKHNRFSHCEIGDV